jgi:hypothetical protein
MKLQQVILIKKLMQKTEAISQVIKQHVLKLL